MLIVYIMQNVILDLNENLNENSVQFYHTYGFKITFLRTSFIQLRGAECTREINFLNYSKNSLHFDGTQEFITMSIRSCHVSVS